MRQLTELSEALLGYLDGGPMTTQELHRKGLVDRLPQPNERLAGSNTILWFRR